MVQHTADTPISSLQKREILVYMIRVIYCCFKEGMMECLVYPCLQMIWCFNNERRAYHSFSSFFFLKTYLTDRNLGLTVTSSAQKVSSSTFLLRSCAFSKHLLLEICR